MVSSYYNIGAPYIMIGRVISGNKVLKYILKEANTDNEVILDKDITEQLALDKKIYNCSAQLYNNIVNLKGIQCKISELPKYDMNGNKIETKKKDLKNYMKLVARLQDGREVVGYKIVRVSDPESEIYIDRDGLLELAKNGILVNAKVQKDHDRVILRAKNGYKIKDIKTEFVKRIQLADEEH